MRRVGLEVRVLAAMTLSACVAACSAEPGGGNLRDIGTGPTQTRDGSVAAADGQSRDGAGDTASGALDDGAAPDAGDDDAAAAEGGEAGADGAGDEAKDAMGDAGADAPPVEVTPGTDAAMLQPSCNPNTTWSAAVAVGGVTFPSRALVTMTSDERTIAWVVDGGDGSGDVFVADRDAVTDPFATAMPLEAAVVAGDGGAGTYFAFDRVALSADAMTLIGVSIDGAHLAEFSRPARGQAFFAFPQPASLAALARQLMPGERLGDPVLSVDGDDLVYSRYGQSFTVSVYEAFRAGSYAWGGGSPRQSDPLQMTGTARKRPTALSSDRLTLFVWDEATSMTYGLFRGGPMDDFAGPQSYGGRFSLQPNASCTRLYYVAPATSGFGLFEVSAM
jgi:hypothetical protein